MFIIFFIVFLIHDYFFAKTLDKVRDGGIIAFITSSGTMDKKSEDVFYALTGFTTPPRFTSLLTIILLTSCIGAIFVIALIYMKMA